MKKAIPGFYPENRPFHRLIDAERELFNDDFLSASDVDARSQRICILAHVATIQVEERLLCRRQGHDVFDARCGEDELLFVAPERAGLVAQCTYAIVIFARYVQVGECV